MRRVDRSGVLLWAGVFLPGVALAQGVPDWSSLPEFTTEIQPGSSAAVSLQVGDQIRLRVRGVNLAPSDPSLPSPAQTPGVPDLATFTLTYLPEAASSQSSSESAPSIRQQGWEYRQLTEGVPPGEVHWIAIVLQPGDRAFPRLAIRATDGRWVGKTTQVSFSAQSAIEPSDPKPKEAAPLLEPLDLAFPWWLIALGALLGTSILLALIYLLWKALKAKGAKKKVSATTPPLPEHEQALLALKKLQASGAIERDEFKRIYHGISEIVKAYLGDRYRVDARESTTRELKLLLSEKTTCPPEWVGRIGVLFDLLDPVKFSDQIPSQEEVQLVFQQAREIIEATRQLPQVESPSGAASAPGLDLGRVPSSNEDRK